MQGKLAHFNTSLAWHAYRGASCYNDNRPKAWQFERPVTGGALEEHLNLASLIEERFPRELAHLLLEAGAEAWRRGERLYLVGGAVRDLLLGRATLDLDLVVEGDAIALARSMAGWGGGQLVVHRRFGTAKWRWRDAVIDVVTSRSESYLRPGALPTVRPGAIAEDLFRRDFTINAMAANLAPDCFGELVDFYGGKRDLEQGYIRILHERSFIDDATRILRAIRYEQRLGFRLEPETGRLLRRDVARLDTISGDRLRHELELILQEAEPEPMLMRAQELGVLKQLHPALRGDDWLGRKFALARRANFGDRPGIYWLLLAYRFTPPEADSFIARFRVSAGLARSLREVIDLRGKLPSLSRTRVARSKLYRLLERYSSRAIEAAALASDAALAREQLELYLSKLRYTRPALSGDALRALGIPPGPLIGEALSLLRDARLDGRVRTRMEEDALVRKWLSEKGAMA